MAKDTFKIVIDLSSQPTISTVHGDFISEHVFFVFRIIVNSWVEEIDFEPSSNIISIDSDI